MGEQAGLCYVTWVHTLEYVLHHKYPSVYIDPKAMVSIPHQPNNKKAIGRRNPPSIPLVPLSLAYL